MIAIIDYGMGNLRSIANALDYLSIENEITSDPQHIRDADKLILPGVGAFSAAMAAIKSTSLDEVLNDTVNKAGKYVLGICLGMQLLGNKSYEGEECEGLGWIPGEVIPIETGAMKLKIPHIGWNLSKLRNSSPLFLGLPSPSDFYFLHSYTFRCDEEITIATTEYGQVITAAVAHGNVFGTQFHPEKSQNQGLAVLRNFANLSG
jgi:glutamine amidotransferase